MNSDLLEYNHRRHLFQIDESELLIEKDIRLTYLNDLYLLRDFLDIGELMKIEEIMVNHRGRSKFKVKVISHGPGKMYKSI